MKKSILFVVLLIIFIPVLSEAMSEQERIDDARAIINLFTQQYGPMKWKEENLGLDFNTLAGKFLEDAKNAKTDKEFYTAVVLFLAGFKDAHISYEIPSSLRAYLPFETEYFRDGVIITAIDRDELPKETFPVEEGDQLIAMDGVNIEDVIQLLIPFSPSGYEQTDKKFMGSTHLTYRPQKVFPDVPKGDTTLTIISHKDGSEFDVIVQWIQRGFDLAEMPSKSAIAIMAKAMSSHRKEKSFLDEFQDSHYVNLRGLEGMETNIGSMIPFFSMWEGFEQRLKTPYFTGSFTAGGYRIGFVRINSWRGSDDDPRINIFEKEVRYLNNNTDALIIDQTNNGGGNDCYMNEIASFFITEPKDAIKFSVRANRTWLALLESNFGNYSEDENAHAKVWLTALRKAVTSGEYLSQPLNDCSPIGKVFPHRGIDKNPLIYTKPVIVLINELDFSAADMFPALMQDWGAARFFGTRTAGAGGNVIEAWPIGNSELSIKLTQSLMYREKEVVTEGGTTTHYMENVGVTPDIEYEVTTKDYYNSYQDYRDAISKTIIDLIERK